MTEAQSKLLTILSYLVRGQDYGHMAKLHLDDLRKLFEEETHD